jgi:dipeptidyl aminopeptidase/acylaminoacyl peptidase
MSGLRLDPAGRLLAVERAAQPGGPTDVVAVDLATGDWTPLLDTGPGHHDCVLLTHPPSGLLLVGTDAAGARQVGWTRLAAEAGTPGPVRFPAALNPGDEGVRPLAVSPDGARVLLARARGARTTLDLYAPDTDQVTALELPPGDVSGPVRWTADALTFTFSTPDEPTRLVSVPHPPPRRLPIPPAVPPARPRPRPPAGPPARRGAPSRTVLAEVPGATGPLEAIVYGGPSWMDAPVLVLALHGGPLSAWRYAYQPLLSRLAAAGAAVVAPNQRGSTGYGVAHATAIAGAWGGPDLADVVHLATALHRHRTGRGAGHGGAGGHGGHGGLRLLGDSYGAYLALLAAAHAPEAFARCAALAPFLSARRLYAEAGPGVRGLVDRLDGRTDPVDALGPRDVLRLCGRIRADLLVAHGALDVMVPVGQSRALRRELLGAGRREGVDLHYLEVPDGTHELTTDPAGPVAEAVVAFLTGPPLAAARTPQTLPTGAAAGGEARPTPTGAGPDHRSRGR